MASLIWKGTGFSQLYCFVHQSPMRVVLRAELDSRKSSVLRGEKKGRSNQVYKMSSQNFNYLPAATWTLFVRCCTSSTQPFQVVLTVKNPPINAGQIRGKGLIPGVRKIPWSRKWQPAPVFLPGESHGKRKLAGYSS